MRNLIYVFIGGGLGSVLRFLISNYSQRLWTVNSFPLGTFLVNIIGCFLIGWFSSYFLKNDSGLRLLLIAGFCGGFTTFSTFSAENYLLWQNGSYGMLILYTLMSVVLGLAAVFAGYEISK